MADKPFLTDIKTLREQARQHIEQGLSRRATGQTAHGAQAAQRGAGHRNCLHTALQTPLFHGGRHQCAERCRRVSAARHRGADARRSDCAAVVQLGGEPNFSPEGLLTRSHAEYVEGDSLIDMIKEDLVAERIAIDSYREMIHYLGNDDSTTRRMMEGILAMEEEHADDLVSLLEELGT